MDLNNERHVVLVAPEVHWNTGNIGRTCLGAGASLHLIRPLGFSLESREVKRAGLDYWPHVNIQHWPDFDTFLSRQDERQLFFFTTKTDRPYYRASFTPGDFLIFGRETKGLPEETLALYSDRCYTLPMSNPHIRSLNLAMSAGIVLYEALRQQQTQARDLFLNNED